MHLLLGLLGLLFVAICSGLDGILKYKKDADFHKNKRPCGMATEYELCWKYYEQWRDQVDRPDFRDQIFADMNSYYGVRAWFENSPYHLENEKLLEGWIRTKARLETAKQGKAPMCLTGGTTAAMPIPDGIEWACKTSISPFTDIKYMGYQESKLEEYRRLDACSK